MVDVTVSGGTPRVILSLDFECGWGGIESGRYLIRQKAGVFKALRPVMKKFVKELDALELPAVWATVGALVSSPAKGDFSHLPVDAQDKVHNFLATADPLTRDGRDLLDIVLSSKIPHEIASHGFSHTRFDYKGLDVERQMEDLEKSIIAIKEITGCRPYSFVFPQNIVPSFTAPDKAGFKVARDIQKSGFLAYRNRTMRIAEQLWRTPPPAQEKRVGNNLRAHSASLFLNWGSGKSASLRRALTLLQAKRALKRTAQGKGDSHFWLHPYNLAEIPYLFDGVIEVLKKAAKLRDKGFLDISTMSDPGNFLVYSS